ncbi:MAG: hypothetical protein KDD52_03670 [Bdellovibrionales bacterium]|nr:hypothetical protein [Bdellovibrionales bacterium]
MCNERAQLILSSTQTGESSIHFILSEIKDVYAHPPIAKEWVDLLDLDIEFDVKGRFFTKHQIQSADYDASELVHNVYMSCSLGSKENSKTH